MDPDALVNGMNTLASSPVSEVSENQRRAILNASNRLIETLENPVEAGFRFMFGTHVSAALRLAIDMRLLDIVNSSDSMVELDDLSSKANCDVVLVARVMRMMAAIGMVKQDEGEGIGYLATPKGTAFMSDKFKRKEAVTFHSHYLPAVAKLPEYFAKTGYQNPNDAFDGPWQFGNSTDKHYFDWMAENPNLQNAFNTVMTVSRQASGPAWFDFYPVEDRLSGHPASDILLVDVGGGLGHDLISFKRRHPHLSGRMILQELPSVIAEAQPLPDGIEAMEHDFFKPQPLKAKAYYMRTVLHDWPDKQARVILQNLRAAMEPTSILLINENVMPDRNVPLLQAQLDFTMLACFSSLDRTVGQFERLLDSAGFELIRAWRPEVAVPGSGTLLEARIKQ